MIDDGQRQLRELRGKRDPGQVIEHQPEPEPADSEPGPLWGNGGSPARPGKLVRYERNSAGKLVQR